MTKSVTMSEWAQARDAVAAMAWALRAHEDPRASACQISAAFETVSALPRGTVRVSRRLEAGLAYAAAVASNDGAIGTFVRDRIEAILRRLGKE